ncbi:MAG: hypothetical protein AYK18_15925 [Theionarchaea archaeon DG-70]|nr:MAG: hypothetical protein AYK18_15925 [Theionarchaea archaeon DG-70]
MKKWASIFFLTWVLPSLVGADSVVIGIHNIKDTHTANVSAQYYNQPTKCDILIIGADDTNVAYAIAVDSQYYVGIKEVQELKKELEWIPQNLPARKSKGYLLTHALTDSSYTIYKGRRE